MLYRVKGTFKGRVFSHDGSFKKAIPTPVNSYEEISYIPECSIARLDESNHTLVLSNSVGLDIYELDEKEFERFIQTIRYK